MLQKLLQPLYDQVEVVLRRSSMQMSISLNALLNHSWLFFMIEKKKEEENFVHGFGLDFGCSSNNSTHTPPLLYDSWSLWLSLACSCQEPCQGLSSSSSVPYWDPAISWQQRLSIFIKIFSFSGNMADDGWGHVTGHEWVFSCLHF